MSPDLMPLMDILLAIKRAADLEPARTRIGPT